MSVGLVKMSKRGGLDSANWACPTGEEAAAARRARKGSFAAAGIGPGIPMTAHMQVEFELGFAGFHRHEVLILLLLLPSLMGCNERSEMEPENNGEPSS